MNDREVEPDSSAGLRRYSVLRHIAELMSRQGALPQLFSELFPRLRQAIAFDFINIALHDDKSGTMRLRLLGDDGNSPPSPLELPVAECASGWTWQNQEPIVFPDITREERFRRLFDWLSARHVRSYCMLPLTTPQHRLGGLGFGSCAPDAFSALDMDFLLSVADLTAMAVQNALTMEVLTEERDRLRALAEANGSVVASLDLQELFPAISGHLGQVVPHDFAGLALFDPETQATFAHILAAPDQVQFDSDRLGLEQFLTATASNPAHARHFGRADLAALGQGLGSHLLEVGIQSLCTVPLTTAKGNMGTLNIGRKRQEGFNDADERLLKVIARQLAIALENARAYAEIEQLKDKLAKEKLYLEDEIRTELNFEEIIGESPALKRALAQVTTVASSDATVLILGETGTGKELVARAIHRTSHRKGNPFIKLNCAAIPTGLLESELFGHERGAFTGAISQKVGRLELADKGTLFLDEVGDIPPELQPKLLRVLQDHEFERLGSNRTLRVNVRLIAATNRDLSKLVSAREFRSDLYYRLNVFPIQVPSLRERRKDIPLLVRYFVQRLAPRMDKQIDAIPTDTMNALTGWDWPGNVRELENFIERSVILTTGKVLQAPLAELHSPTEVVTQRRDLTLETAEREHILRILREVGGIISGPRGAAARLGLKRTTLQSKMQKLRIARQDYQN
ncbi:MAG TPA: sigma 54-interacting transcriptional regulator [Terriglobales bacterium]